MRIGRQWPSDAGGKSGSGRTRANKRSLHNKTAVFVRTHAARPTFEISSALPLGSGGEGVAITSGAKIAAVCTVLFE